MAHPCPDANDVTDYLEGSLAGGARAAMEAHVAECWSCQQVLLALAASPTVQGLQETFEGPGEPGAVVALAAGVRVGRYQVERCLGHGGMGVVYAARDLEIERRVALKVLHPGKAASLLAEAQAQARVDHPHVCKVYEVLTDAPRPTIVMQLVDGVTLDVAARSMTVAEKARAAIAVCGAVHAAHRLGLVHRDLKPSNILVERLDDGWHPCVTDFGLAVDLRAPAQVAPTAGTPAFMAPEQLRGEPVDARTDVYGLGATLYALLAGRPPFSGKGRDPDAAAAPLSGVPRDLEAIVQRCLAPAPGARYPSAREVALDLERFLAGRPVESRGHAPLYRAGKLVRRHRALTAVVVVAVGAVGTLVYRGWRERALSVERQALSAKFSREVDDVDRVMHDAHGLPLHDVGRERALVRTRLAGIRDEMARLGEVAVGPGEYALARGALALHDHPAARASLERAWRAGDRGSEVAAATGEVLAFLYQDELARAERIADRRARERRELAIAVELRDPALAWLAAAGTSDESGDTRALTWLLAGGLDEAVVAGDAAFADNPRAYQARRFTGDAHLGKARVDFHAGRHREARAELALAAADYQTAIAIGRSDPELRAAECARACLAVEEADDSGGDVAAPAAEAERACADAVIADPSALAPRIDASLLASRLARHASTHDDDPLPQLDLAVERASGALAVDGQSDEALRARAHAERLRADIVADRGEDPTPTLLLAAADLDRAAALAPGFAPILVERGRVARSVAANQEKHGQDAIAGYAEAVATLERAVADQPDSFDGYLALGDAEEDLMRVEGFARDRGHDWHPALSAAHDAYDHALAINPGSYVANQGQAKLVQQAQTFVVFAQLPALAAQAIPYLERATQLNPNEADPEADLAEGYLDLARAKLAGTGDPTADLDAAIAHAEAARAIDPRSQWALVVDGAAECARGEVDLHLGLDPSPHYARSAAAFARAGELDPSNVQLVKDALDTEQRVAEWAVAHFADPRPTIAHGLAIAARGLALEPRFSLVRFFDARLHYLRATWLIARKLPFLDDVGAAIADCDYILATHPFFPIVQATRAELLLLKIPTVRDPAERLRLAGQARDDAARALYHPNLPPDYYVTYRAILDEARAIAGDRAP